MKILTFHRMTISNLTSIWSELETYFYEENHSIDIGEGGLRHWINRPAILMICQSRELVMVGVWTGRVGLGDIPNLTHVFELVGLATRISWIVILTQPNPTLKIRIGLSWVVGLPSLRINQPFLLSYFLQLIYIYIKI